MLDLERTRQTFRFSTMAVYAARPALGRAFGYHLAVSLRRGSGLAMTLATPLALVVALRSRAPMLVLAAAFSALYFVVGACALWAGLAAGNAGLVFGAVLLLAIAAYHYVAGWHLAIDQTEEAPQPSLGRRHLEKRLAAW